MSYRTTITKTARNVIAATGASILMAGSVFAADLGTYKGVAEPDPAPARNLELSANVALTTDYVFRGFSQTDEGPAIQGGFDASYGAFYAGVWASNLDFGAAPVGTGDAADIEIDWYGGFKHSIRNIEFDLGVIYYSYPNAADLPGAELDFVELKFGWSYTLFKDLGVSTTLYYSPEYTGEIGDNFVLETSLEKPLGRGFSLSGTLGNQWGDEGDGGFDYTYWNVGVSKSFYQDKFSLDVRYWDTADVAGCSTASPFQCDSRVVGTLSSSF